MHRDVHEEEALKMKMKNHDDRNTLNTLTR